MTSPRSLSYLLCATCNDVTLHDYNCCPQCGTRTLMSAVPPMPSTKALRFGQDAAQSRRRVNGLAARSRARAARNRFMSALR